MTAAPIAAHRAPSTTGAAWAASARRLLSGLQWAGAAVGALCLLLTLGAALLGLQPLVVESGSMAPGIPTGSVVLATTVPAADVVPGEVVGVVRDDDSVLLHRLVSTTTAPALGPAARTLVTKGDANDEVDPPSTVAEVQRPVLTITGTGHLVSFARGRWILFWTGVVAGVVVSVLAGGALRRRPEPR